MAAVHRRLVRTARRGPGHRRRGRRERSPPPPASRSVRSPSSASSLSSALPPSENADREKRSPDAGGAEVAEHEPRISGLARGVRAKRAVGLTAATAPGHRHRAPAASGHLAQRGPHVPRLPRCPRAREGRGRAAGPRGRPASPGRGSRRRAWCMRSRRSGGERGRRSRIRQQGLPLGARRTPGRAKRLELHQRCSATEERWPAGRSGPATPGSTACTDSSALATADTSLESVSSPSRSRSTADRLVAGLGGGAHRQHLGVRAPPACRAVASARPPAARQQSPARPAGRAGGPAPRSPRSAVAGSPRPAPPPAAAGAPRVPIAAGRRPRGGPRRGSPAPAARARERHRAAHGPSPPAAAPPRGAPVAHPGCRPGADRTAHRPGPFGRPPSRTRLPPHSPPSRVRAGPPAAARRRRPTTGR